MGKQSVQVSPEKLQSLIQKSWMRFVGCNIVTDDNKKRPPISLSGHYEYFIGQARSTHSKRFEYDNIPSRSMLFWLVFCCQQKCVTPTDVWSQRSELGLTLLVTKPHTAMTITIKNVADMSVGVSNHCVWVQYKVLLRWGRTPTLRVAPVPTECIFFCCLYKVTKNK